MTSIRNWPKIRMILLLLPRILGLFYWLARPTAWNDTFDLWSFALLGLLFMPWATITSVFLNTANWGGETSWFLFIPAVLADLATNFGPHLFGRLRGKQTGTRESVSYQVNDLPNKRPIPDSYQVEFTVLPSSTSPTGTLLAGQYAGDKDRDETERRMALFLDAGVSLFVDLTEANEFPLPYAPILTATAAERNTAVEHLRLPIPDRNIPSAEQLIAILDTLDDGLSQGQTIYVHCWGGIGRTGTVIGCWLVRHGLNGEQALTQIAAWRASIPSGSYRSPETEAQRQMILDWHEPTT